MRTEEGGHWNNDREIRLIAGDKTLITVHWGQRREDIGIMTEEVGQITDDKTLLTVHWGQRNKDNNLKTGDLGQRVKDRGLKNKTEVLEKSA